MKDYFTRDYNPAEEFSSEGAQVISSGGTDPELPEGLIIKIGVRYGGIYTITFLKKPRHSYEASAAAVLVGLGIDPGDPSSLEGTKVTALRQSSDSFIGLRTSE